MPIKKEDDGFVAHCSTCERLTETDEVCFNAAVAHIQDLGWKVFKDRSGEWQHICSKCKEGLK